jgi:hypothetical protein
MQWWRPLKLKLLPDIRQHCWGGSQVRGRKSDKQIVRGILIKAETCSNRLPLFSSHTPYTKQAYNLRCVPDAKVRACRDQVRAHLPRFHVSQHIPIANANICNHLQQLFRARQTHEGKSNVSYLNVTIMRGLSR